MGTRLSEPTLFVVRMLRKKGYQGQRGAGRRTELFPMVPASKVALALGEVRDYAFLTNPLQSLRLFG